jgi:signal transduction histidine kinase
LRPLIDVWRSATSRLILIYGSLFAVWCVILLGAVHWETSRYLSSVIDQLLLQRLHYLQASDPAKIQDIVDQASRIDSRGVMSVGLFDAGGKLVAGDIEKLPSELLKDGTTYSLHAKLDPQNANTETRARGVVVTLKDGRRLVVAKESGTVDGIGVIIKRGLIWGLSLTLLPGLLGGILIARGPARRIREIQKATEPIRHGDLSQRLPVSRRGDELDVLAGIVNTMLGEIERLMGEVKGVCDNIAHDLRTPLTRLRSRLYRAQQQLGEQPEAALLDACVADVDSLMSRFRALLRISELEDRQRSACFGEVDVAGVVHQVHEFYAPLAEDRGQRFELVVDDRLEPLRGDPHLLFEALANLVGNALKFTPAGGRIVLSARMDGTGPVIEVRDSGPGIPVGEREAVTRRFYRGDNSRSTPGSGLGLSIVSAIARLHGYTLDIGGADAGARLILRCY